jgi:hypothetical protein
MLPETSIIKAFLNYKTWGTYSPQLQADSFPEDLQLLYRTLDSFHKTNQEQVDLHLYDLANLFFSNRPKDREFYEGIFSTLETYEPNLATVKSLITSLKRAKVLRELSIKSYEVAEGKKPYEDLEAVLASLDKQEEQVEEECVFVSDNLNDILDATYRTPGLRWRLQALNKSLGSLRKGDFGFVFARPEVGKTTWLASEATFMAEQAEGPVLWINNEEVSEKVKSRIYQAALGYTTAQLLSNPEKCTQEYNDKFKGKILLPKESVSNRTAIENLCKQVKPSLIIIDTIDGVTGFKADREDLVLGAIYKWARELAKEYAPIIAVCHADGTAENCKWLNMGHVVNAKTEKQKHADWILGIGALHDTGWENVRFLSLSKNKLTGDLDSDPALRHGHMECLIDPMIARYKDI